MKCDSLENRECRRAFVYIFCDHDPSSICVPLTYLLASFTVSAGAIYFLLRYRIVPRTKQNGRSNAIIGVLGRKKLADPFQRGLFPCSSAYLGLRFPLFLDPTSNFHGRREDECGV